MALHVPLVSVREASAVAVVTSMLLEVAIEMMRVNEMQRVNETTRAAVVAIEMMRVNEMMRGMNGMWVVAGGGTAGEGNSKGANVLV